MKLVSSDIHARGYTVHDCEGKIIPDVFAYDTETKEVSMYLNVSSANSKGFIMGYHKFIMEPRNSGSNGRKRVTFILEGSYAKDKDGNIL